MLVTAATQQSEGTDYATVGNVLLTINANQTTGTATFRLNPTDDDFDEDNESLTVDGSVTGLSVTATTVTIQDDDTAAVTVNPDNVDSARRRKLKLHSRVDVATDQQRDSNTVAHRQPGCDSHTVVVDVHAGQLVNSTNSDSHSSAGCRRRSTTQQQSRMPSPGADYATVTAASVTVTVTDNETVSTGVVLTVAPVTLSEDAAATTITVTATLNQAPRDDATVLNVNVGDSSDTAVEGTDYATVGNVLLTINANQTTGTATFRLNPTDDDFDEDNESLTVDGSVTGTERDSNNSDNPRRRHSRSHSQPNNVDSARRRKLKLHSRVDVATDQQRDSNTVAHRQPGCDSHTVGVDVHAGQLVNSTNSDSHSSAGCRRGQRHSNNRACRHRSGLCNSHSSNSDSDRHRQRNSVDRGGADGGTGHALRRRGGDHDHGHSNIESGTA